MKDLVCVVGTGQWALVKSLTLTLKANRDVRTWVSWTSSQLPIYSVQEFGDD
jgi:hypothetical protein